MLRDFPRILVVDHFDSYTLNLLSLFHLPNDEQDSRKAETGNHLAGIISDRVVVLPHTHPLLHPTTFKQLVRPHIDAVILSPGPGSPDKACDFGAAELLLKDPHLNLPVLGVCLGHQGLATAFGGHINRAASVRHGLASKLNIVSPSYEAELITGPGEVSLLDGIPQGTSVIRYNSLVVNPESLPDCLRVTAWSHDEISSAPPPHPARCRQLRKTTGIERLDHAAPRSMVSTPLESARSSLSLSNEISRAVDSDGATASEPSSISDMTDQNQKGESPLPAHAHTAIMALEHRTLPFHGVQFHPESVESAFGHRIMFNFLDIVRAFWVKQAQSSDSTVRADAMRRQQLWCDSKLRFPTLILKAGESCLAGGSHLSSPSNSAERAHSQLSLATHRFPASREADVEAQMSRIFGQLFRDASPVGAVWLDSARSKDPHSRYSYMAIPAFALSYRCNSRRLTISASETVAQTNSLPLQDGSNVSFWNYMNGLQAQIQACTSSLTLSDGLQTADGALFRSGFTGYFGYEMKDESLGLPTLPSGKIGDGFDAEFFFCNRVLAYDHKCNQWIAFALVAGESHAAAGILGNLQEALRSCRGQGAQSASIGQCSYEAAAWFDDLESQIRLICEAPIDHFVPTELQAVIPPLRPRVSAQDYMEQIESARELIAEGESYELCMTNQFQGQLPALSCSKDAQDLDHFLLYCQLRVRNPAPYSAYMRLPSIASSLSARARAILSTSPERFVCISKDGGVEMKPIKGTLARAGYGPGEESMRPDGLSVEQEDLKSRWRVAEDDKRRHALSADVKERAENLMIVDLIRADLYSFCKLDSISVPELMQVESYETVHQLVTTVRGQLKENVGTTEAIQRCFPPGSMTGAPKRRSVQLLERLEMNLADAEQDHALRAHRGIYSGTLGWMGVDGAADFSVVIRTLVANGDNVSIGAGGAITYLSDAEKEWQEVLDKVNALAAVDCSAT